MSLFTIKLTGRTYPHREVLRVLNYSWQHYQGAWVKYRVEEWETKLALANTQNGKWPDVQATIKCESPEPSKH